MIKKLPCFNLLTIRNILEGHIFLLKWKWDKYSIVSRNLFRWFFRFIEHLSYWDFYRYVQVMHLVLKFWKCQHTKMPDRYRLSIHHTIWSLTFSSPVHETLYTDILYKQTGSQIIFPFALFIWDEITPHVSDLNFGNTASWERCYPWTYKSSL